MADFGGVTLQASGLLGNLDPKRFVTIAHALAHAVAEIHGRGVIHKDLNPANILVRPSDLQVQIIDYDLATTFAEEHPGFDHPSALPGTPAYLSPEQTGRMNRPVDYRTDLYSLGATLYALATGAPPFAGTDTLGLIHAHLARTPAPPQARAPWLPPRVAELILILLAKEPDDRYQSAAGLAHDLRLVAHRAGRRSATRGGAVEGARPDPGPPPAAPPVRSRAGIGNADDGLYRRDRGRCAWPLCGRLLGGRQDGADPRDPPAGDAGQRALHQRQVRAVQPRPPVSGPGAGHAPVVPVAAGGTGGTGRVMARAHPRGRRPGRGRLVRGRTGTGGPAR